MQDAFTCTYRRINEMWKIMFALRRDFSEKNIDLYKSRGKFISIVAEYRAATVIILALPNAAELCRY
jgi:hypothetical protein